MNLFGNRKPVEASDRAKAALGVKVVAPLKPAAVAEATTQALSVAEIAPPPPPRSVIPSDPGAHLRYAERAVEQMDKDEADVLGEIEQEEAAHAAKIATLKGTLDGIRKTRAFYRGASGFLADQPAAEGEPEPEVRRPRLTASRRRQAEKATAAAAEKLHGQEATNEQ